VHSIAQTRIRRGCATSVVAVSLLAAVVGLAGCHGGTPAGSGGSSSPSVSASPSSSVDRAVADATAKALAAYNGFRRAVVTAEASADYNNKDLPKFAADPALSQVKADLYQKQQQGFVMTGRPQWSPAVGSVNVTTRPYTVQITDCLDTTNWTTVDKAGKPVGVPGQAKRYVVTSEAKQYDTGTWLIDQSTADRSRPC